MKLLCLTADPHTLLCHRRELLTDLSAAGWTITAAAAGPGGKAEDFLRSLGGTYRPLRMTRSGMNPVHDYQTWQDMRRIIRAERPDALFAYTIKSVAYGSLAAASEGVRHIYPLLCGLGYAFAGGGGMKQRLVSAVSARLYKSALARASCVFLQNQDDLALLRQRGILQARTPTEVVAGSGVDLEAFAATPLDMAAAGEGKVRFVLVSRMLRSKGVPAFIAAAQELKAQHPGWEFHLVGGTDPGPDGIPESELRSLTASGVVTWHGSHPDVKPFLRMAHCFVLPTTYREGVPRTLLETLSSGRPVITTDSVGSRETVRLDAAAEAQRAAGAPVVEGANGFLIQPGNHAALITAMQRFGTETDRMQARADASRAYAAERFDVRLVNAAMMARMVRPTGRSTAPRHTQPVPALAT